MNVVHSTFGTLVQNDSAKGADAAVDVATTRESSDAPSFDERDAPGLDASGACGMGTIRFRVSSATATRYCLGGGTTCLDDWLSVRRERQESGELYPLAHTCQTDCATCQGQGCTGVCTNPARMPLAGADWIWYGTYYTQQTCNNGVSCAAPACVPYTR